MKASLKAKGRPPKSDVPEAAAPAPAAVAPKASLKMKLAVLAVIFAVALGAYIKK